MKFTPAIVPVPSHPEAVLALLFNDEGQLLLTPELRPPVHQGSDGVYLGLLDDQPCVVARVSHDTPNLEAHDLRPLHGVVPDELYALMGYATQILTWSETHRFCSMCGTATRPSDTERAMVCTACGFHSYPRISPCIIVAVTKGEELLMCRGHHFPEGLFSVVAGFVDPGETLEQCVAREVMEETGISVANIQYHSNQPWPFPHSLMIAFTADYAGGDLEIDPKEIEAAGWYTTDTLPKIPSKSTIARTLIDDYLSNQA